MHGLITGIMLFTSAALVATSLQVRYRLSYAKNPLLFLSLFLVCISVSCWTLNYVPSLLLMTSLIFLASMYVFGMLLLANFWKPMQRLYGAGTVPAAYQEIIHPKLSGQVVKVVEIALQDMSAWLIVGGLFTISHSVFYSMLVFTTIVFLLHIPGLWMFGRVYGTYFLVLVTMVALCVPLLYQASEVGFVYLYALHLCGYIAMYLFMALLGSCYKQKIN